MLLNNLSKKQFSMSKKPSNVVLLSLNKKCTKRFLKKSSLLRTFSMFAQWCRSLKLFFCFYTEILDFHLLLKRRDKLHFDCSGFKPGPLALIAVTKPNSPWPIRVYCILTGGFLGLHEQPLSGCGAQELPVALGLVPGVLANGETGIRTKMSPGCMVKGNPFQFHGHGFKPSPKLSIYRR